MKTQLIMNNYKIKEIFWKAVFKIGFVKKWYIGNELLKNPPTVYANTDCDVKNMTFVNVTLKAMNDNKIINNNFKSTLKLRLTDTDNHATDAIRYATEPRLK